jgi:hypothetical protein
MAHQNAATADFLPARQNFGHRNTVLRMQACLCLVEKRETRYRVQWYYKLFVQTMRGLNK